MHIDVSSSGPNGVSVHMYGSATNPYIKFLGPFAPSIHWDVNISLNMNPDGSETQYTVNGSRGNFPASEIDIDDQMITGGDVSIGGYKVSQGNIANIIASALGVVLGVNYPPGTSILTNNFATIPAELYSKQNFLGFGIVPAGDPLAVTSRPPSSITAGTPFGLVVTAQNSDGTVNTSFDGPITIALFDGDGNSSTINGTTTLQAVNGVATFSGLSVDQAGGLYTLIVTCNTLPSVTTDYFEVTPSAATQLVASAPTVPVL